MMSKDKSRFRYLTEFYREGEDDIPIENLLGETIHRIEVCEREIGRGIGILLFATYPTIYIIGYPTYTNDQLLSLNNIPRILNEPIIACKSFHILDTWDDSIPKIVTKQEFSTSKGKMCMVWKVDREKYGRVNTPIILHASDMEFENASFDAGHGMLYEEWKAIGLKGMEKDKK